MHAGCHSERAVEPGSPVGANQRNSPAEHARIDGWHNAGEAVKGFNAIGLLELQREGTQYRNERGHCAVRAQTLAVVIIGTLEQRRVNNNKNNTHA